MKHHVFKSDNGWVAYTSSGDLVALGHPEWSEQQARQEADQLPDQPSKWIKLERLACCLTLNVSHLCNLRCRYCYAEDGSYSTDDGLMDPDVARQAIRYFVRPERPAVLELKFFGGEPLLNLPAVRAALDELDRIDPETRPKIGVVTNGTLISPEFIDLCERYDMTVTVSIDGPPFVHDRLRLSAAGTGTYEQVLRGIELLTGSLHAHRLRYEATYTRKHQEAGLSRLDLVKHMCSLGLPVGFTYEYIGTDGNLAPLPDNQALSFRKVMLNNMLIDDPFTDYECVRLISLLVSRRYSIYFCPVAVANYLVSPTGDVYPCNLFVEPQFRMGNIADPDWENSEVANRVRRKLDVAINRSNSAECVECWMFELCGGCPAVPYKETGRLDPPVGKSCAAKKAMTEQTLGWLADVSADPDKWNSLKRTLTKLCKLEG